MIVSSEEFCEKLSVQNIEKFKVQIIEIPEIEEFRHFGPTPIRSETDTLKRTVPKRPNIEPGKTVAVIQQHSRISQNSSFHVQDSRTS